MIISGWQDRQHEEGVGLVLTFHTRSALWNSLAISSRPFIAEFLSHSGPFTVIAAYTPTKQDTTEAKDNFYSQLDSLMHRANNRVWWLC